MWNWFSTKRSGNRELTPRQLMLSAKVRELLTATRIKFEEAVQLDGEAVHVFKITTAPEASLTVRIIVVDDAFQFEANGALLIRDRGAWPAGHDDHDWAEECIWVLKLLLASDLRIRECRTLFGRTSRAVWLATGKNDGGWNGELPAVRRRQCPERVFANWYQRSELP